MNHRSNEPDFIGENHPLCSCRAFRARLTAEIWYDSDAIQRERKIACAAVLTSARQLMNPIFQQKRMYLSFLLEFSA